MSDRNTLDQTNPAEYVETAMRGRMDDVRVLLRAAEGAEDLSYGELHALQGLGVGDNPPDGEEACDLQSEADERLYEYPLCVERTTTFEVVFGTGGPDDRLCFECDVIEPAPMQNAMGPAGYNRSYEVRRVFYRYSWSGTATVDLFGDDREAAEAYGRRMVPELAE